ncbi:hypothetical protein [Flavobacterium sp. MDT1-60]|uniref:alpha-glutamyl/putrescinyl thymine pyrophosphorylase clade 3 protein n=1 Tax=Flavobacterium sp. MDT1-60 TaxID=1979344 RepID=UPI00178340E6|nr:hypothetical protein [Flavobacterium sp. MDT1-60]QOG03479.1 hypothetical protein IHE43_04335 [Flavobacterium sp. MDT1-60]
MRKKDIAEYNSIKQKLQNYTIKTLPGIVSAVNLDCFTWQMVDSVKRVKYVTTIRDKNISQICTNPNNNAFDPIKAASYYKSIGNIDEAFWLVFLAIHFGKNKKTKWALVRAVYSGLSNSVKWNWQTVKNNPKAFQQWLHINKDSLKKAGSVGNHRKYISLNALGNSGTGAAVLSYVDWVTSQGGTHQVFFQNLFGAETNAKKKFNIAYKSMSQVRSFGRMGKFDYLTMIGKLQLVDIVPDSVYMVGATGPYSGAKFLFGGNPSRIELNNFLSDLEIHLGLDFGMQVLEDAICNWNKNRSKYVYFGG